MSSKSSHLAVIAALSIALADPGLLPRVSHHELVGRRTIPESQLDATVKAARLFYEFWDTGDEGGPQSGRSRPTSQTILYRRGARRGLRAGVRIATVSAPRCRTLR